MICGEVLCKQFEYEYCGTRVGEYVEGSMTVEAPDEKSIDAVAAQKLRDLGIVMSVGSFDLNLDGASNALKCPGCNLRYSSVVMSGNTLAATIEAPV